MLVKCVCSNCGHSFLTDDQAGELTCARCGFVNEAEPAQDFQPQGFEVPAPEAPSPHDMDSGFDMPPPPVDAPWEDPQQHSHAPIHFNPNQRPPVFLTAGRALRGMVLGGLLTACLGAAVGAALGATGFIIPGVCGVIVGFGAGAALRSVIGGRSAARSATLARLAVFVVVLFGAAGTVAGSWMVERFTGTRAAVVRKDLDIGKKELVTQLARAQKVGDVATATLLDTRIQRVERLEASSNAELEDYLWMQEAQFGQPLLAYGKLRVMHAPMLKLGPDAEPKAAPKNAAPAIFAGEYILAMILAFLGFRSKR